MTDREAVVTDDAEVIGAITNRRLVDWSSSRDTPTARAAARTCATIGNQVADQAAQVSTWLRDHAVDVEVDDSPRQRHELTVRVSSVDAAYAVARSLAGHGFEPWDRWTRGAERSFRHHADQLTVARTTEHSFVVRLRWRDSPGSGRIRSIARRITRPTRGDWTMVSLPSPIWPLYSAVRPVRLVLERTGLRDRFAAGLGPFLSTPRSLIEPLLELADVGPDDGVLDVGCGDGRLVIAAARSSGCRSVGVELDPELADRARRHAREAGVADRVEIVCGDARDVDTTGITATFMFLPMDAVTDQIGSSLGRLPIGGRLVIHEQTPLSGSVTPRPDSSHAVIAPDAVTVAHVWHRT